MLRSSRAALLAALASLALLQVAAAEHKTEHAADEVETSCELCLKLDEAKASFADNGADSAMPVPAADLGATVCIGTVVVAARPTHIRAPPPLV